jgi:hypothetical protein
MCHHQIQPPAWKPEDGQHKIAQINVNYFFSQFRNNFKVAPAHRAVAVAARVLAIFTVNRPVIP